MIQTICESDLSRFLRETETKLEEEQVKQNLEMRVISFSPIGEYVVSIFKIKEDEAEAFKAEFDDEMLENVVQTVVGTISPVTALSSALLDIVDLNDAFKGMQYYEKFKYNSRLSTEHIKVYVAEFSNELKEMIMTQQSDRIKKIKKKLSIGDSKEANKDFLVLCPELETQCPGAMKILGNIG